VFFDRPRCILCFRCVRICDEGMGVGALGIVNRGAISEIAPNRGHHLECDECGACIDICPVGALTSGIYRYKTRPWEMTHVGTICTHCSNGCKTTLGVFNNRIERGNNRDRSGINGEFLCIKGRYGFDFYNHPDRLQTPLARLEGELEPVSWSRAIELVAAKFHQVLKGSGRLGIIGSNRTTNEENYYLQKLARQGLGTNNIDHFRTGDVVTLVDALSGSKRSLATVADLYERKAVLVAGADLALEQPLLSFQIRANWRHHQARIYVVTERPVREDNYAAASLRVAPGGELAGVESLRERLAAEPELVVLYGAAIKGEAVRRLVEFCDGLGLPLVQYVPLLGYANSRGALDMGLTPELLPGYRPAAGPGMTANQMLRAANLEALWVIGANPGEVALPANHTFLVVQDLFLTETAKQADVVLPAASAYEKSGTFTSVTGEVQRLRKAVEVMGAKPDLEIFGLIGRELGLAPMLGPWIPDKVFEEIRRTVPGYDVSLAPMAAGGAAQTSPVNGRIPVEIRPELIRPAGDNLFTSGTLGRYSKILNSVFEKSITP
ncbi:MAG: 4Fe-4S dicluster domain-containing protein, partial [Acidobacteria bacterium]|nr:4Fe-4S dicluster domain-containing protein [Acidobacteriota bacterium]